MGATLNVTITGYNRPEYLERTLAALSRCEDIGRVGVAVLLDPCDETDQQAKVAAKFGFQSHVFNERAGCNRAIHAAIDYGFSKMGSEFHVHLEDDTVPCRDALRWFATMAAWTRDDPKILNVSGYQRVSNGRTNEAGLRRWFTPWGWGVWKDRWLGLSAGWSRKPDVSWDVIVNYALRAGRYEAFPTVSRIQNIGGEKGTHVPSPEWHAQHHHVAETADDIPGEMVNGWTITRVDEKADHA
jgi:hypothetical protein